MPTASSQCQYVNPEGQACGNDAQDNGLCCWHDADLDKSDPSWKHRLQDYAKSGRSMSGFQLHRMDLSGINLVNNGQRFGYDLSYADLYHCNLAHAHLFMLNLKGASLMKADLAYANLHYASLEKANLLGANFKHTRIEHVAWGDELRQVTLAKRALAEGKQELSNSLFEESEEICRRIRNAAEGDGLFDLAGHFFHQEMVCRRNQLPRYSPKRIISKFVDLISGYGEKPLNVIIASIVLIAFCALLYAFFGIHDGDEDIRFSLDAGFMELLHTYLECLYYSTVTFTTLGYGDIVPLGWSRAVAAVEAFVGSFSIALFVVVFVKKMTR
jgi:hypothetical protein